MMLKSYAVALAASVIAAGCGSVAPTGMLAAARLDPLTTPPGKISVAVRVPTQVRLAEGDAGLYLAFAPDDPQQAAPIATTVPLRVLADTSGPRAATSEDVVYVFGFSPDAAAEIAATQAEITALREGGVMGTGTLSVAITGGCLTAPLPEGALPVATWLRTDPANGFVPLTRSTDMRDMLTGTRLPPC
ncbi:hypothetical protein [Tropicimonas sp. S265A]|uniref:hypothetical protein n=1 Tax=Tropicimonas sp. S265A TaxID=3415134 RepID=UPI003C7D2563